MARATEAARPEEPRDLAPEIPTKYLPGVPYADMPEPLPFRKMMGPSVILLGTAIASGELILWPYIAAKVGLVFLWAAYVGLLTQYFINMEVERYTLATGETAVTGFTRLWKPWGIVFVLLTALPNIWPAWATGAATFFTFATEWGSVAWLTIFALVAIGIALTVSPVVYQTVEKIEMVKIFLVLLFLLLATAIATTGAASFPRS